MARQPKRSTMTAEQWNAKHPVGTRVRYQNVKGVEEYEFSETRSEAWALGHGDVVVSIKGRTGGVLIDHLTIMESP